MKNLCKISTFFFVLLNISLVKILNCNENDFEKIPSWLFETNKKNDKKEKEKTNLKFTTIDDQKIETYTNSSNNDQIEKTKKRKFDNTFEESKAKKLKDESFNAAHIANKLLENNSISIDKNTIILISKKGKTKVIQRKYSLETPLNNPDYKEEKLYSGQTTQQITEDKSYTTEKNSETTIQETNAQPQIFQLKPLQQDENILQLKNKSNFKLTSQKNNSNETLQEESSTAYDRDDDDSTSRTIINTENQEDPLGELVMYVVSYLYMHIATLLYHDAAEKKQTPDSIKQVDN